MGCVISINTAAQLGKVDLVRQKLAAGADVNRRGGEYNTWHNPLTCAAEYGHVEVMQVLLEAGADINLSTNGRSALEGAAERNQTAAVEWLIANGARVDDGLYSTSPLEEAVSNDNERMMQALLEAGANPNGRKQALQCNQPSALELAVTKGSEAMVAALLAEGANPNARCTGARTPLMLARQMRKVAIVGMLEGTLEARGEAPRDKPFGKDEGWDDCDDVEGGAAGGPDVDGALAAIARELVQVQMDPPDVAAVRELRRRAAALLSPGLSVDAVAVPVAAAAVLPTAQPLN